MMARLIGGDSLTAFKNSDRAFVTVSEPAAGYGAMVLAFADAMRADGLNYQQQMHAIMTDVDITAVHMAYIQCSLCHIPAIVTHENSLSMETWSKWHTSAHVLGFRDDKLVRRQRQDAELKPKLETTVQNAEHSPIAPSPVATDIAVP